MHLRQLPFLLIAALAVGCQSYRPAPLDLDRHRAAWAARDPASPSIADYARTLADRNADPAAPFDAADGLTLAEAEVVALFFNPRLRVARLRAAAPRAGAAEAGRWADPELDITGERILESVANPWILGATLSFTLPISGRLEIERRQAESAADVELLRAYAEEIALLAQLRARWIAWAANRQRIDLLTAYLADLAEIRGAADKLQQAGELDATDVRLFRIEHVRRQAELRAMNLAAREQEAEIKAILGLTPDAPIPLHPSLSPDTAPRSPAEQHVPLDLDHPRLLLARAEYEAAERALELEVRRQYPDLTLAGGGGEDEGESRVLFGAALPLPLFNRNIRAIAEARAARDAARAAAEAAFEDLVHDLHRARLGAASAADRRQTLERDVVPLVDEQVADLRRLGQAGEFNTLVLLEALRTAHETRLELLEATARSALADVELEALDRPGVPPPALWDAKEKQR